MVRNVAQIMSKIAEALQIFAECESGVALVFCLSSFGGRKWFLKKCVRIKLSSKNRGSREEIRTERLNLNALMFSSN